MLSWMVAKIPESNVLLMSQWMEYWFVSVIPILRHLLMIY
jgi:hypothetical protein